jgi:hypothetical protein
MDPATSDLIDQRTDSYGGFNEVAYSQRTGDFFVANPVKAAAGGATAL